MIDGAILDGKITFWTVNFSESEKQPHSDTTGNEWIYLRPAVWLLQRPDGHNMEAGAGSEDC